jgi:hypothetical protein
MRCGETQELLGVFTVTKFPAVSIYPSNTGLGELRKLAKVQLNYQIVARLQSQKNDPEGGRAALAAAKALDPGVVAEFARYGLGE